MLSSDSVLFMKDCSSTQTVRFLGCSQRLTQIYFQKFPTVFHSRPVNNSKPGCPSQKACSMNIHAKKADGLKYIFVYIWLFQFARKMNKISHSEKRKEKCSLINFSYFAYDQSTHSDIYGNFIASVWKCLYFLLPSISVAFISFQTTLMQDRTVGYMFHSRRFDSCLSSRNNIYSVRIEIPNRSKKITIRVI